jgi:hypothetical protein
LGALEKTKRQLSKQGDVMNAIKRRSAMIEYLGTL